MKKKMYIVFVGKATKNGNVGVLVAPSPGGYVATSLGNALRMNFGQQTGLIVFESAGFKGKVGTECPSDEFAWTSDTLPQRQQDIDANRKPLLRIAVKEQNSIGVESEG